MKLSVIIVNYNVKYFLEQCLLSVQKASKDMLTEVFVVDNNSVDGSVELVKEKFPYVILIENKENIGFSRANNQAINQANGEYILLLNPDTVVEEDTFEKCVQFMDERPDAGGLGVKMMDGNGNFLPESKRGLPTPSVAFYKVFGLSALFSESKKFGQYHLGYLDKNEIHEVDILSGAFMLIRKKTLDEIGLLDEKFFMYGEDIDLSYRITQAGYKNYYFPHTRIIHYKGESTKKSSINYVFVFYRAMVIFAEKHFSEKNARLFSLLINFAVYLRASLAVFSRFTKTAFLPLLDFSVLITGIFILKNIYHQQTGIVYDDWLVSIAFPIYALVWVFVIFLSGGYDKPTNLWNTIRGILLGTAVILVGYALLPEGYRFSRALILLGMSWLLITSVISRLFLHFSGWKYFKMGKKVSSRFAIVGEENEINRISDLLKQGITQPEFIAQVSPENPSGNENSNYIAHLGQLKEVVGIFKIDEVIFCSKNLQAQSIISQMSLLENPEIEFKIAPPESMFIIGSKSINVAGDVYSMMDVNAITKAANRRNKRMLDIGLSLIFLPFYPVLFAFVKKPLVFFAHIFAVFFGIKTWVGYADAPKNEQLPKIKTSILNPIDIQAQNHESNLADKLNLAYAKNYSVWNDLKIIRSGFKNLGRS